MTSARPLALVTAASVSASLLLALPSASQSPSSSTQPARSYATVTRSLDKLASTIAKYGGKLGVSMIEVDSGQTIAATGEHDALNPASNMKLLTAAAALAQLSGTWQYRTALYGKRNGAAVDELVLRGQGDPSLETVDLMEMASRLRASGVRKIQGDILVDQSFFDDQWIPPGFEQQPNEWAYFRAPVSAVALERNAVTMNVHPTVADQPAAVSFIPPGLVDVAGSVKTSDGGAQNVTLTLVPNGARLTARLGGTIPQDARTLSTPRRIDNPSLAAGYALRAILAEQGIAVGGSVKAGGDRARSVLVQHRSRPMSELLYELGKHSDNFYAEMVFKSLAAKKKSRGLSAGDGAAAVIEYLKSVDAHEDGTVIKNGSGLFDTNRVTASALTKVLRAAWHDPASSSEYVAHLAIGGVDGTLHGRFTGTKKQRLVRAKTGTLNDVAALSGYVLSPGGRAPVAFSVLINGVAGKVTGARAAMDKCVGTLVRSVARARLPSALPAADDEE